MSAENIPIKVLIIDDDEEDYLLTSQFIQKIRGRKFVIDWCYRYKDALDAIIEAKYDIYFIDYYLGGKTGLELMKEAIETLSTAAHLEIERYRAGTYSLMKKRLRPL